MRKLRIMEHISLDGVIQPAGDGDFAQGGWQAPYRTPAGAAALAEAQGTSFDLLLGRRMRNHVVRPWACMVWTRCSTPDGVG